MQFNGILTGQSDRAYSECSSNRPILLVWINAKISEVPTKNLFSSLLKSLQKPSWSIFTLAGSTRVFAQTPPGGRSLPSFAYGLTSRVFFFYFLSCSKIGEKMWDLSVEISLLPLTGHIAYTTACCNRTSHIQWTLYR